MKSFDQCLLYAFIDTAYLAGRSPTQLAEELCRGGADVIQLRAKGCSPDEVRDLALPIKRVTDRTEVKLVINDHPSIAREVGASAVHLGQEDFFDEGYGDASQVTGSPPKTGLGLSTHAPDQAIRALAAKPDYIAIGPVFATQTKPGVRPVSLSYVKWAAGNVSIPWFAIGGITLENLDEVLRAGARRVCVVSAILNAPDVAQACQSFKKRLVCAP